MNIFSFRMAGLLLVAAGVVGPVSAAKINPPAAAAPSKTDKAEKHQQAAAAFFAGPVPRLKIVLPPEEQAKLQKDERHYAGAMLIETLPTGLMTTQQVSVKLKGSTGTFQHLGGRPSMTLNFDHVAGGGRFHGMKKIHLNNAVQDHTYLAELMAGEVARKAGVPASRCTQAFVELNGRNVGIYVVKEAFTKDFIAAFYKNPNGDLYDGGSYKEIHAGMEKDHGDPKDNAALLELIAACQNKDPDPAKRWERLGKILDIERYMKFTAMETILCHWDGYNYFNHNNYRLYRDPDTGKFSFFLHGMDNCFGDENFSLAPNFKLPRGPMVGAAVMSCPQGPPMYWAAVKKIYEDALKQEDWAARVNVAGSRLRDAIAEKDPARARAYYDSTVKQAMLRIPRRIANVGRQLQDPVKPFFVEKAGVKISKAWVLDTSTGGKGDKVKLDGRNCLHLVATGAGVPSWRLKVQLEPGRYRMGTIMGVRGVEAVEDEHGRGGGICIAGASKRSNVLEGDGGFHAGEAGGQSAGYEFETRGGEVELVFELRATKGEVWFAVDNFGLTRGE